MAMLSNIAKRTGQAGKSGATTVRDIATSELSSYVKSFGIVGEALVATTRGVFGERDGKASRKTKPAASPVSTMSDSVTTVASDISIIKSTLLAINKTLRSMLDIQRRDRADRLYAAEGLTREKAAGLSVLSEARGKDKSGTNWALIGAAIMSAISTFVGFIKDLPGKLLSIFGSVAGVIKDVVVGALTLFKDGIVNLFQWLSSKLPGMPTIVDAVKTAGRGVLAAARFAGPIAGVAAVAGGLGYMISQDRGNKDLTDVEARQAEAMQSGIVSPEEVSQTYAGAIKQTESVGGLPGVLDRERPRVIPQENISRLGADPVLGGINYEGYKEAVGKRESGSKGYRAENTLGYLGKYQMGVPALIDAGLMIPNPVGRTNKEKVNNPANWRGGYSKEEFLNNPELQEDVMRKYTIMNYRVGRNIGVIKKEDAPEMVAAKLASAHLVGWGNKAKGVAGARDYFESGGKVNPGDAYGTKVAEYANIGRASQQGVMSSMQPSTEGTAVSKGAAVAEKSQAAAAAPVSVNVASAPTVVAPNRGGAAQGPRVSTFNETIVNDPSMLSLDNLVSYAP